MNIGLIMHPYGEKHPAGLGRAIFSLAKHIIEGDVFGNRYTVFVKGGGKPKPDIRGDNWEFAELPEGLLWLDTGLRKAQRQDVYLFFTPFMPFFFTTRKSVVVAHDFSYLHLPAGSIKRFFINKLLYYIHRSALRRAESVVSVSDYTKDEIVREFGIAPHKIRTIYNGFDPVCSGAVSRADNVKPYFLFVGVIKPRKNVLRLVEAYAGYVKERAMDKVPDLVIAGKGGGSYYNKINSFVRKHKLEKKVIFKGYVPDGELPGLYANALAFVFPSLIEGFGLPLLEAMQCGAPIITSDRGALKEVAGEAALLVDPTDTESIKSGLRAIAEESILREELSKKGRVRCREFSWKKAGREYIKLVSSL